MKNPVRSVPPIRARAREHGLSDRARLWLVALVCAAIVCAIYVPLLERLASAVAGR